MVFLYRWDFCIPSSFVAGQFCIPSCFCSLGYFVSPSRAGICLAMLPIFWQFIDRSDVVLLLEQLH